MQYRHPVTGDVHIRLPLCVAESVFESIHESVYDGFSTEPLNGSQYLYRKMHVITSAAQLGCPFDPGESELQG